SRWNAGCGRSGQRGTGGGILLSPPELRDSVFPGSAPTHTPPFHIPAGKGSGNGSSGVPATFRGGGNGWCRPDLLQREEAARSERGAGLRNTLSSACACHGNHNGGKSFMTIESAVRNRFFKTS